MILISYAEDTLLSYMFKYMQKLSLYNVYPL